MEKEHMDESQSISSKKFSGVAILSLFFILSISRFFTTLLSPIILNILELITKLEVVTSESGIALISTSVRNIIGIMLIFFLIHLSIIPKLSRNLEVETVEENKIIWTVKLFLVILGFQVLILLLLSTLFSSGEINTSSSYAQFLTSFQLKMIFFITATIFAPLFEELLFRRTLIPLIQNEGVTTTVAVIVSSVLFASSHTLADILSGSVYFAVLHFFTSLALGLILGFVYVKTRNIVYPIIFHGMNNAFSSGTTLLSDLSDINPVLTNFILISLFIGISIGLAIGTYRIIRNYNRYLDNLFNFLSEFFTPEFNNKTVWLTIIAGISLFFIFPLIAISLRSYLSFSIQQIIFLYWSFIAVSCSIMIFLKFNR